MRRQFQIEKVSWTRNKCGTMIQTPAQQFHVDVASTTHGPIKYDNRHPTDPKEASKRKDMLQERRMIHIGTGHYLPEEHRHMPLEVAGNHRVRWSAPWVCSFAWDLLLQWDPVMEWVSLHKILEDPSTSLQKLPFKSIEYIIYCILKYLPEHLVTRTFKSSIKGPYKMCFFVCLWHLSIFI